MIETGKPMRALGMMSGTSLDGVDAAVVVTDGVSIFGYGETAFRPYTPSEQHVLRAALGTWPGQSNSLAAATAIVEQAHMELAAQFSDVDVIGFHGQTFAHDPVAGRTHQAGSGQALAQAAGCPVVWDFRSADMAAGGQGAPLAPFFHFAALKAASVLHRCAVVNIGGVANITWADLTYAASEQSGALIAFDTGPGNALINDAMLRRQARDYDASGAFAAQGQPDLALLQMLDLPYLRMPPPKSLDRDAFEAVMEAVDQVSDADAIATLTAFTAETIAASVHHLPDLPDHWYICGGGRHNTTLMQMLAERLYAPLDPVEVLGWNGDMLEAQAFGYLAVRVINQLPTSSPGTTGCARPVCGGQISLP